MTRKAIATSVVYEAVSILGKHIRITKKYWEYICENKHDELENRLDLVILTLKDADKVYQKSDDVDVNLYYKKINRHFVCVVTRHLNGDGFVITAYLTSKTKRKGKQIYAKKEK